MIDMANILRVKKLNRSSKKGKEIKYQAKKVKSLKHFEKRKVGEGTYVFYFIYGIGYLSS